MIYNVIDEEKKKYIRKYQEILNERLCLEISLIRLVHLGLPRAGKTITQLRLFNKIVDILTEGIKDHPSTGVAETYQVIIGLIESQKWSISKNLQEEMGILNELFVHATAPTTSTSDTSHINIFTSDRSSCAGNSAPSDQSVPSSSSENPSRAPLTTEGIEDLLQETIATQDFDKAIRQLDNTIMLLNSDMGGQAAYLEMLGPLVVGPSLYLVYHRLTDQLDEEYDIWATNDEGESTEKEKSTITVEDFLFQALTSISCFSQRKNEKCPEGLNKEALTKCTGLSRRSEAMLVGTYLDKVSDQCLKERDDLLQNKFDDFVERGSQEQLVLAVNNESGDQDDINKFRSALEDAIHRCFGKIEIPVSWLLLSLNIRNKGVPTMNLSDCEVLAGKFGIDSDELQVALWFFHHMMGIHLYYKEVKELEDVVICNVKVIYDSITNLVKNSFSFKKAGSKAAKFFKETAQFSQDTLDRAASRPTDSPIPPPKLVKLLEYLNILTTLTPNAIQGQSEDNDKDRLYFMPCLLRSAKASELQVPHSDFDPASLMIQFDCVYVPLGVFSATITNIISQKLEDWNLCDERKKNKVQFRIGKGADMVTLISRPKYIEIVLVQSESCDGSSTPALCSRVRSAMEFTLEKVTKRMNYDFNMEYHYAFACPLHPGEDHRCTLANESDIVMKCSREKESEFSELNWNHKVWFNGMYNT